jgi:hypothetical protein
VLVAGIVDRMDGAFRLMATTNWASATQVSEESPFILQFNSVLVEAVSRIRDSLSSSYLTNFCSKLSSEILSKYLDVIMRQKRISEPGTQQLLLDTYNLKTLLLHLHQLGLPPDSSSTSSNAKLAAPNMYVKLVTSRVTHIETILKLVGTPEEMLLERFK